MNIYQQLYKQEIEALAAAWNRALQAGYMPAGSGLISARMEDGNLLLSCGMPCGKSVGFEDVAIVTPEGTPLHASTDVFSLSLPLHQCIYKHRPDVKTVIDALPPCLTGFAINGGSWLANPLLPQTVMQVGPLLTIPYAVSPNKEYERALEKALELSNGFLLENQGALVLSQVGPAHGLELLSLMEAQAKSILVAKMLGGAQTLPKGDVALLDAILQANGQPLPGSGKHHSLVEIMFDD